MLSSKDSLFLAALNSNDDAKEAADSIILINILSGECIKLFKTTQSVQSVSLIQNNKILLKFFDGSLQIIGKKQKRKF